VKIVSYALVTVVTVVMVVFTVNNTSPVAVDLWPVLSGTVDLPLTVVVFVGIFFGLLAGFIVSWFIGGRTRRRARALQRRIESDQRDMAMLRRQLAKFEAAERDARIPLPPANAA
jgi:uncharacterized integral membrane protein